jgi:uncharacterized protein (DUF2267 family)
VAGAAIEPPPSDRFLERVAAHSGDTLTDARRMTDATLATLAERLPPGQARELAAHLPEELAAPLLAADGSSEPFTYHEFVHRVAERECVSSRSARDDASAVMATIAEVMPGVGDGVHRCVAARGLQPAARAAPPPVRRGRARHRARLPGLALAGLELGHLGLRAAPPARA